MRRAVIMVLFLFSHVPSEIPSAIRDAFIAEASRHSFLGNAADSVAENEGGYQQNFENGAVFMLDSIFEVHGLILDKYRRLVGPWGYLGFPLSDELTCDDGAGRYSVFRNGAVYYHPTYGTHQVTGTVLSKWRAGGAESGPLGYPVDDPVVCDTGIVQRFQGGQVGTRCQTIDMRQHMYRVGMRLRNQGWRGTCSVFAMTCILEYDYAQLLGGGYADLSEEYMNHVANLASGQTDDGSCFEPVAQGYAAYGVVPEPWLPYDLSKSYNFPTFVLPDSTIAKGRALLTQQLRLKEIVIQPGCPSASTLGLSSGRMDTVFMELNKGYPVAAGRGHSLTVVGCAMDASFPGGGFFIIRNSYGPDADDKGYRYETVEHFKNTVYDAYAYEMPAGVSFGKTVRGRVSDGNGNGISGAHVEISGIAGTYGAFTRYDSTDESGCFRIPKINSLATAVIVRASCAAGSSSRNCMLTTDTTDADLTVGATGLNAASSSRSERPWLVVREGAGGNCVVTVTAPAGLVTSVAMLSLDGRVISRAAVTGGAGGTAVPAGRLGCGVFLVRLTSGSTPATARVAVRNLTR